MYESTIQFIFKFSNNKTFNTCYDKGNAMQIENKKKFPFLLNHGNNIEIMRLLFKTQ